MIIWDHQVWSTDYLLPFGSQPRSVGRENVSAAFEKKKDHSRSSVTGTAEVAIAIAADVARYNILEEEEKEGVSKKRYFSDNL